MSQRSPDIRTVLGRLEGLGTTADLGAAGISPTRIRTQLKTGALVQLSRGVYALPGLAEAAVGDPAREHALATAAAIRRLGSGAVASHQSAALIHGLSLLSRPHPAKVTLTRSPEGSKSRSGRVGTRLHIAEIPPAHRTTAHGVQVTTVARTVVDLARTVPFVEGVVVADSALHDRNTAWGELIAVQAAYPHWPGSRRAEHVIDFSDRRAESVLESVARVSFDEHGLPAPRLQAWVGGEEGIVGRADFFWPEHSTIGEADGALKYSTPTRAISQLERDAWLREAGFEVVHFTWHQITTVPWQVVPSLRAAFGRADAARALEAGADRQVQPQI